jgi:hypothetical protein
MALIDVLHGCQPPTRQVKILFECPTTLVLASHPQYTKTVRQQAAVCKLLASPST